MPIVVVRSILLLCIYLSLGLVARAATQQRKITVSGIVTDSSGEPVIGASITEKGTSNGTISDVKGHFGISVSSTAILQISFIGYRTEEVTASPAKTSLKVILRENSEQLEEVVVVGYGVQKKANLTGSVASVNFKDVNTMPVANTTNMLQGRLPGVVLTNNGAQAGKDTPEIRIRGVGTLSGNNDPMVLIDGVEASVAQIAQIPAGDIDNVSVLKDAASASIYGVRAANGGILITTNPSLPFLIPVALLFKRQPYYPIMWALMTGRKCIMMLKALTFILLKCCRRFKMVPIPIILLIQIGQENCFIRQRCISITFPSVEEEKIHII